MSPSKSVTLASLLHRFFVDYLPRQRALSPHTLFSYRDSIKLLLQFFVKKHGDISKLAVEDLTVTHITVFLQHLEIERSKRLFEKSWQLPGECVGCAPNFWRQE
jgi:integrase/recombinase XerD